LVLLPIALADPAAAQPSPEEIAAIRQACRSDFITHCSGVQPGGREALQCLERNAAQLSAPCASAVGAVAPNAATETRPEAPAAAQHLRRSLLSRRRRMSSPPSNRPAQSRISCRTAPGSSPATCQTALAAIGAPSPSTPGPGAAIPDAGAPAAAPPTDRLVIPRLPLRAEIMILRVCAAESRNLCGDVPPGGGRIVGCLARNASRLMPECRAVLSEIAARGR
jgi:Cysteine rich repeat